MKLNVNLAQKSPSGPYPMSPPDEAHDEFYPIFHTHTKEDLDLPIEGTMVIRYHIHRAVSTKDENGKHTYDCDIEVKELVSVKGEEKAPARSGSEAGEALDRLAEENYGEDEES